MKKNVNKKDSMKSARAIVIAVLILTLAMPASSQAAGPLVGIVARKVATAIIIDVLGNAAWDFIKEQLGDDTRPQTIHKKAAEGNVAARNILNHIHEKARAGNADAQTTLGDMYYRGHGVPRNDRQAVYWFRQAVAQGYAPAQDHLGWMYRQGRGVPQNDRQSVYWSRKAAAQGYASAQYHLGWLYQHGRGVPRDDRQALYWYRQAAAQGDVDAQNALREMRTLSLR